MGRGRLLRLEEQLLCAGAEPVEPRAVWSPLDAAAPRSGVVWAGAHRDHARAEDHDGERGSDEEIVHGANLSFKVQPVSEGAAGDACMALSVVAGRSVRRVEVDAVELLARLRDVVGGGAAGSDDAGGEDHGEEGDGGDDVVHWESLSEQGG